LPEAKPSGAVDPEDRSNGPPRVAAVFPEPTPYRAPLLDRIAQRDDLDLTVLYAAETVAGRTWTVPLHHRHDVLAGVRLPGVRRMLRHDYPITLGVWRALSHASPQVVVASGWSTFASQAAVVWCRLHGIPYLLVVESHDRDARPGWRRTIKGAIVPRVVKGAAGVLVTGTLARESMLARGARPDRIRVFANTVDVEAFGERADVLAGRRAELREALGLSTADVAVLSVARLAPEKGLDVLVRAAAQTGDPGVVILAAGEGPQRGSLESLAAGLGVRLSLLGDLDWERIVEAYVAADVFALLSRSEPWGVVVNEAAACRLPLVLSDAVGAAHDLVVEGENGFLVPAGDVASATAALRSLAGDPALRSRFGAASRRIVSAWGYAPSVEGFVELVRLAAAARNG
jgi:glycosyltransferase involved in cell wall biosynthesis